MQGSSRLKAEKPPKTPKDPNSKTLGLGFRVQGFYGFRATAQGLLCGVRVQGLRVSGLG